MNIQKTDRHIIFSICTLFFVFIKPVYGGDDNQNGKIDIGESINWNVPYINQMDYCPGNCACGPTSLAMVLQFWYSGGHEVNDPQLIANTNIKHYGSVSGETIYNNGVITGNNSLKPHDEEWRPKCNLSKNACAPDTTTGILTGAKIDSMNSYVDLYHKFIKNKYGNVCERGLSSTLVKDEELKQDEVVEKIKHSILDGPIVISTKLQGGHYIVIKGIDEQGNFIVNDPFGNPNKKGYSNGHTGNEGEGVTIEYGKSYSGNIFAINTGLLLIRPINDSFSINDRIIENDTDRYGFSIEGDNKWLYSYYQTDNLPAGYLITKTNTGKRVNSARWTPHIGEAGWYEVYAGFITNKDNSKSVTYTVHDGQGKDHSVAVSQYAEKDKYHDAYLGTYFLTSGKRSYVEVNDKTGEKEERDINIDVMKFKFVAEECHVCPTFPDVPLSSWYYWYVQKLFLEKAISGYPDGNFKGEQNINRVEFLKLVLEASKENYKFNTPNEDPYLDVPQSEWFAPYVSFAKEHGILEEIVKADKENNTCEENNFCPAKEVTRQEAITILVKSFNKLQGKYDVLRERDNIENLFPDVSDKNVSYYYYVYTCRDAGIIEGYPDGSFRPDLPINRAEIAKIICLAKYGDTFMSIWEKSSTMLRDIFPWY